MLEYRVVLVEPKVEGNIGSVARVMKNFGQTQLFIVKGPPLGDVAESRALHARDVLFAAQRVETLEQALQGVDYVVGTTARVPDPSKTYLRVPIEAREFPPKLRNVSGRVALLFGREDFGLFNTELELCDLLITIPTSDLYRSLNLSQAVGILLYEVFVATTQPTTRPAPTMSGEMRSHFQATMDALVDAMQMPEHQARNTKTAYRKLFGRAVPTSWEYFVLMGVFRRCLERFGIETPQGGKLPDFDLPADLSEGELSVLDERSEEAKVRAQGQNP